MSTDNPFAEWATPDDSDTSVAPAASTLPPMLRAPERTLTNSPLLPQENPFAEFVRKTPIEEALAARDAEVAQFQAEQQKRYEQQQAYAKQLIAEHPELAQPSAMQEEAPSVDPYKQFHKPPLAPREEAPKQPLGSGFEAYTKQALVDNPDTKRKILADTLFPNDPEGIYRVGFDRDGQPVYVGDDEKLHKIASGTESFGAQFLANLPETGGAFAGSALGPWWGAPTGAMTAHAAKRYVAGKIFGEPLDLPQLARTTAAEGVTTLAGEGFGRGLNAFVNARRVVDFTPQNRAAAEQVIQNVKRQTGIDLDLAQASGDKRLIALRAYVARYPGPSANLVQASEDAQKGQFHTATDRVLNAINATPVPAESAGKAGINAAEATITLAREAAQARVQPLYDAAYNAGYAIVDPKVLRFFKFPYFKEAFRRGQIIAQLEEKQAPTVTVRTPVPPTPNMTMSATPSPPGMTVTPRPNVPTPPPALGYQPAPAGLLTHEAPTPGTDLVRSPGTALRPAPEVDDLGNLVTPQGAGPQFQRTRTQQGFYRFTQNPQYTQQQIQVPDLRSLDYTKRGLDAVIEDLMASGQKQLARALSRQRGKYVRALDNLGIPEYAAARHAWTTELRHNIEPLENGVVGVLAKIKEPQANKAAARIFSDPNLTPTMVLDAKAAIRAKYPSEWDRLTRTWIANQYNKAQRVTQTGAEINAAGKFHQALFGTPTARANTIAMLDKPAADALEGVMEAASHLASTPTAGSNTFRDLETQKIFSGLTGRAYQLVDAIRRPFDTIRSLGERRAVEESTMQFAEAILDPTKRDKLRVILRMKPSTQRSVLLFSTLAAQTGKDYAKSRVRQGEDSHLIAEDEEPNALSQP